MFAEKRANVLIYNFKFWNFHLEYFKILAHMFLTLFLTHVFNSV